MKLFCEILFVLFVGILWRNTAAVINDQNDTFKTTKRRDILPADSNNGILSTYSGNVIEPPPDTFRESIEARISNFEATTPVFPLTAPPENYGPALLPPKQEASFSEKDSPGYSYELPPQHGSSYELPPQHGSSFELPPPPPPHASSFEHSQFPGPTFNHFPRPAFPPPKSHYGPPPRPLYTPLPPKPSYILYPKPSYGPQQPSFGSSQPRPHFEYAPPSKPSPSGNNYGSYKPEFIPAVRPVYGPPPKPIYRPTKSDFAHSSKPLYRPPARPDLGPPFQSDYGSKLTPKFPPSSFLPQHFGTSFKSGLHDGLSHPPHNVHSPPTPPIVSYDGWRPIKGPEFKDLSFNQLNTIDDHSTLAQPEQSIGLFSGDLLPPLLSQSPAIYSAVSGNDHSLLDFPATFAVPSTPHHHGPECDQPAGNQLASNGCCGPPPASLSHPPYENQGLEYGVPYGVPSGKQIEGPNLRPKSPVKFRPPVPPGLLEPSGLHGSSQHSNFPGQSYIPPAVPEISKSNDNEKTPSVDYSSKDTDAFEVPPKPSSSLEAPYHPKTVDYYVPRPVHAKEPSQHFAPPPAAAAVSLTGPNFSHETLPQSSSFPVPNEHNLYFGGHQFGAGFQPDFQSAVPTGGNLLDFSNQGLQYNQWPNGEQQQQLGHDQIVPGDLLQNVLSAIEQQPNPGGGFELPPHGGEYGDASEHLLTAGSDHVQYNATPDQIDEGANPLEENGDGEPLQRLAKEINDKNKDVEKASNFTNGHTSSINQNISVNAQNDKESVTRKANSLIKNRNFKLTDHSIFSQNSSYSARPAATSTTLSATS